MTVCDRIVKCTEKVSKSFFQNFCMKESDNCLCKNKTPKEWMKSEVVDMSSSSPYKPLGHRKNCKCALCKRRREWEKKDAKPSE